MKKLDIKDRGIRVLEQIIGKTILL